MRTTFSFICLMLSIVVTEARQKSEPSAHVRFVDAGIKSDHMWISLVNYRTESFINTEVSYTLCALDKGRPLVQNRQLPPTAFERFPVIELRIDLGDLGIKLEQDTTIAFILFVTDGNSGRVGSFLKRVLPFQVSRGTIGFLDQNALFPTERIPLFYSFEMMGQDVYVFAELREERESLSRIVGLNSVGIMQESTVSALEKIQAKKLGLRQRNAVLQLVSALAAKKMTEGTFRSRIQKTAR